MWGPWQPDVPRDENPDLQRAINLSLQESNDSLAAVRSNPISMHGQPSCSMRWQALLPTPPHYFNLSDAPQQQGWRTNNYSNCRS